MRHLVDKRLSQPQRVVDGDENAAEIMLKGMAGGAESERPQLGLRDVAVWIHRVDELLELRVGGWPARQQRRPDGEMRVIGWRRDYVSAERSAPGCRPDRNF